MLLIGIGSMHAWLIDGMGRRSRAHTHAADAGRSLSTQTHAEQLAPGHGCMPGPGSGRRQEGQGDLWRPLRPICRVVRACMRRGLQIRPAPVPLLVYCTSVPADARARQYLLDRLASSFHAFVSLSSPSSSSSSSSSSGGNITHVRRARTP
jgi:hypothetical protein